MSLPLLFLILSAPFASAHIGSTYEQCVLLYGQPKETQSDGAVVFVKAPLMVGCVFNGGICDTMVVSRAKASANGKPERLSSTEVTAQLAANGGGKPWNRVQAESANDVYMTEDYLLVAIHTAVENQLIIATKAAYDKIPAPETETGKSDAASAPPARPARPAVAPQANSMVRIVSPSSKAGTSASPPADPRSFWIVNKHGERIWATITGVDVAGDRVSCIANGGRDYFFAISELNEETQEKVKALGR